jgi:TPR repeat protein
MPQTTADRWRRLAFIDVNGALNNLGVAFHSGQIVTPDQVEATYWWRKATAKDQAPTKNNLSLAYYGGQRAGNDGPKALEFWLKSILKDKRRRVFS